MQLVSSRIWTRVAVFISYDDNNYTTSTSNYVYDKTDSNNAREFCDEDLNLWFEKIGCKPYKTPPYHPQSNGLVERMVQTVKKWDWKHVLNKKEKIEVFLPRPLLSTIPNT